jgi:hypothetical protein
MVRNCVYRATKNVCLEALALSRELILFPEIMKLA